MIWNSWADFFAMGGYGLYVWGSTVAVAACMLGEIVGLRMRRKAAAEQLRMVQRAAKKGSQ
jgi:heme exporter protein D